MLITPYSHKKEFSNVEGCCNCIGKDIAPLTIVSSDEEILEWESNTKRQLPKNVVDFLANGKVKNQQYFYLEKMKPYQAITPWIIIPADCYASIGPRSTLSKMNCLVNESADIDPGFEGYLFVLLLPLTNLKIKKGLPILSLKMYKVKDRVQTYSGFYKYLKQKDAK